MFDRGSREGFFQVWSRLLSAYLRQHNPICQNVEFYLMVYFTIFPIHPINPNGPDFEAHKKEIDQFKSYLESKGTELSSLSEFLPFYALPYIKNPQVFLGIYYSKKEHPSFSAIFTKEWAIALRKRLEEYLNQVLPSLEEPKLYKLYETFQKYGRVSYSAGADPMRHSDALQDELAHLQKENQALFEEREANKEKLLESQKNWTFFSKDILSISQELYRAIVSLLNNQKISPEMLATSRNQIDKYEQFLNENQAIFRDQRASSSELSQKDLSTRNEQKPPPEPVKPSLLQKPKEDDITKQLKSPQFGQPIGGIELNEAQSIIENQPVDYKKVKQFLLTSIDDLKICAVLQALRWRITRNKKRTGRLSIMSEYIREDLLGCKNNGYILERLLTHKNKKVIEYMVSLLDELVIENLGTIYLTSQNKSMPLLAEIMTSEVIFL